MFSRYFCLCIQLFYSLKKGTTFVEKRAITVSHKMGEIYCPPSELQLKFTLSGGQSFRWKETSEGHWTGVFAHRVWTISRDNDKIIYKVCGNGENTRDLTTKKRGIKASNTKSKETDEISDTDRSLLIDYFRLNTSLKELYGEWSNNDPNFCDVSKVFQGVRILKQDPVENIFSFICSSNNFISRISSMVEKLCTFYGEKICDIDGQSYYGFPKLEALARPGVDEELRKAGFGYRAKYIHKSAETMITLGGEAWLRNLKELIYGEAKIELMKLHGVGAKVADCICLMSLGHLEAIPVDTHVFQIATQYYLPQLKSAKSLTSKIYNEIGDHFRSLYGPLAGWAHTILFCADLKKFHTPETVVKRKLNTKKEKSKKAKCAENLK